VSLRETPQRAYVVEQYLPHAAAADVERFIHALRDAAAAITVTGAPVRLACSILVAGDDLCLHVLTTPSAKSAIQTADLAGITPERTADVTAWWFPDRPDQ
jgi:hypothetical protein